MPLVGYLLFIIFFIGACKSSKPTEIATAIVPEDIDSTIVNERGDTLDQLILTEEEWREKLTDEEFRILRKKGTEKAFSGDLWDNKKEGLYTCAGCGTVLFTSSAKYDSDTGWPSFFRPDDEKLIKKAVDHQIGYPRTEVLCARCGGHLGHVFEDGPPPTGLRYCINSAALNFIESKE